MPLAIERLFDDHHHRMFRAAYRVTGEESDAEDALQTVFLRLLRRPATPDLTPSPGGYLHRAAINAALDIVRARSQRATVAIEQAAEPEGPASSRPDRRHDQIELRESLRRAIAGLNPRAAEMFVHRYFEGDDLKTIAAAFGTSRSVVAVTLFRTRRRLKQELRTARGESR